MVKKKKGGYTSSAINLPPESLPESPPVVAPTKKAYEPVEESPDCSISYSEGVPRRHHNFFMDTGDFFLQVEKAVFRIHRYHLIGHSQIWMGMLSSTQDDQAGASEERPWVPVEDDKYRGWELLLSIFYRKNPLIAVAHTGQEAIEILEIAHRYQMITIEQTIISRLENATSTPEFVDLMVASRMVQSESLGEKAMKGLLDSATMPDLNEAKRLGLDTYYALWDSTGNCRGYPCRSCNIGNICCGFCGRSQ